MLAGGDIWISGVTRLTGVAETTADDGTGLKTEGPLTERLEDKPRIRI